jgi:phosphatidylinositol dimannoside acyltransferase
MPWSREAIRASREAILAALRPDAAIWRKAMAAGVHFGPDRFVRYSPPVFGLAFAAALPKARELVRANLRRVVGPRPALEELRDVASVFAAYASCLTEALLLGSGRGYALRSSARGVHHYHACAAEGRGVIIATAHTGGWEVAGPVLSGVHPAEVVIVMRRERDERAQAIHDEARLRAGVKVVHIGDSPFDALPLLRHLQGRAVVAMQIDRVHPGMRTRDVMFLGARSPAPEGPLTLAALSGAPILPIFTRRLGFMEYEAIVSPPIRLPRRPRESELDQAAQTMMGAMEDFVRAHPTQWFHFAG